MKEQDIQPKIKLMIESKMNLMGEEKKREEELRQLEQEIDLISLAFAIRDIKTRIKDEAYKKIKDENDISPKELVDYIFNRISERLEYYEAEYEHILG